MKLNSKPINAKDFLMNHRNNQMDLHNKQKKLSLKVKQNNNANK